MSAFLRYLVAVSLVLFAVVMLESLIAGTVHHGRARMMLTLVVVAAGGTLIIADLVAPRTPWETRVGIAGSVATLAAVSISLLLIWTDLIRVANAWRAWWVLSGLSLTSAHILVLRRALGDKPWRLWARRTTIGGTLCFATLVIALTFRRDVLAPPGPFLLYPIWAALAVEVVGSLFLWFWARPDPQPVTIPWRAFRWGWYIVSPVLLLALGFYLGRVTAPGEGLFKRDAGALAAMSPQEIDDMVQLDLDRLRSIADSIASGQRRAVELRRTVVEAMKAQKRTVFTPDEDDALRSLFFTYLACRTALLRMATSYQDFTAVQDPARRQRCFLVGFAAGTVVFDASLAIVALCHDEPLVCDKLNEPEEAWGIPKMMFDRVHESVTQTKNAEVFEEMCAYYEERRSEWSRCGLDADDLSWLERALDHGIGAVRKSPLYGRGVPLRLVLEKVKQDAYTPVYAVQTLMSTWIGDTRIVRKKSSITRQQLEELRAKLEPGDVILERRNWYLSNAFLPGFWPHAELYVGTPEQVEKLGLRDEPAVRDRWDKFTTPGHDKEPQCILESISEGVSFSTLPEGCSADYIVVLRPRVGLEEKKKAIVRAFTHQGKPYDFEFDFFSADKLVCTELVYRAYEGIVHFELKKIMGRMTLPAVEMARKFTKEAGTAKQELEFVGFLDTPRGGDRAVWADAAMFCESAERPRAFGE